MEDGRASFALVDQPHPLVLVATAAFGLEAVVSRELDRLGFYERTVEDGRVIFGGDEAAVCRANLWLRSADRVLVQVGAFEAGEFGELFDQTTALPWAEWLPVDAAFPVQARSVRSQLSSVPHIQSNVKKAIVESLKHRYRRDWFEESGPTCAVDVVVHKDRVTLALDSTGPGLHKRGYRRLVGSAPLKETLAAGLVQLSYWDCDRPLIDPFCGSGTIPIEAALIGRNIAPGRNRTFASESWPRLPAKLWTEARAEARELEYRGDVSPILGYDIDADVLKLARHHASAAGVESDIHIQQQPFSALTTSRRYGCLITNPPWGERLSALRDVEALYREIGCVLSPHDTWSIYVLTSHRQFENLYGRRAARRRKLYNGRIECTYYQFPGPRPPGL